MTITVNLTFTADVAGFGIDDRHFYGMPSTLMNDDFKRREPIAWAVAQEFNENGTASGTIVITAA